MPTPPRPWPDAPPANHRAFFPEGMTGAYLPQGRGADLFFCHGLTPQSPQAKMMEAIVRFDDETLRRLIRQHPEVPPDFTNSNGITPLMVAAAQNNAGALHILADHPLVNLSQQSRDGWTALHYAAYFGHPHMIAALLARQADFKVRNTQGEEAYALAKNAQAQEVFWENKTFAAGRKRPRPAPDAAGNHTAAAPEMESVSPLSAAFAEVLRQAGHNAAAAELMFRKLHADIAAGRSDSLRHSYEALQDSANQTDYTAQWDRLFNAAAQHGNLGALFLIAEKRGYSDAKPLTDALEAALSVQGSADPQVVHWLLRWGANANAESRSMTKGGHATLAYQCFTQNRTEAFEQICLWGGPLKSWHMSQTQLVFEIRARRAAAIGYGDAHARAAADQLAQSVSILKIKKTLQGDNASTLQEKLWKTLRTPQEDISDRLPTLMAIYAEAQHKRFRHHTPVLNPTDTAAVLAEALQAGKLAFAHRMVADGHHLKNLRSFALEAALHDIERGPESPVRDFIRAHKDGSLLLPKVLSISEQFEQLRALAAQSVRPSGRGYGGF